MNATLPTGTVTFLMTDIEGSTRLWEDHPEDMARALARHDRIISEVIAGGTGSTLKTRGEGDSTFNVFARAEDAVACALAIQRSLAAEPWPVTTRVRARVALHTGEAELRDGDYFGAAINRCARLRAAAHGGQVVLSAATAELVRDALPDGTSLADLGLHALRDLARPERVFQLDHPDFATTFPPLRSLSAARNNLPTMLTSFVGRDAERDQVRALLEAARLVTLTGPGGSGKTRLALDVARSSIEAFGDGVWLADLGAVTDPAHVATAVATSLGLREEVGCSLEETIASYCRGRALLLVLDNCEHLLEACATIAMGILSASPDTRILATGREALGVPGEVTWSTPPLALDDGMQLFVERAALLRPGFSAEEHRAALERICARLDGLPLAIELAAARVGVFTVAQIADHLDDRFRLLTGGSRTAPARQQTLRATLDWSYDLLDDAERVVLARLSVFAGGFTIEAAEAVCGTDPIATDQVVVHLATLVQRSLVVMDEGEGEARYRLLETVREYARERLAERGDLRAATDAHRRWFLAMAERARGELTGPIQGAWFERLTEERENLRTAVASGVEARAAADVARLGVALWRFFEVRGHLDEGRRWLAAGLAFGASLSDQDRAALCAGVGALAFAQADYQAAGSAFEQARALYEDLGDAGSRASAATGLANVAYARGDHDEARQLYEESLAVFRAAGDKRAVAVTLNNLANVASDRREEAEARDLLRESLSIRRELGDDRGIAMALTGLGNLALSDGDTAEAGRLHRESLEHSTRVGHRWGMAAAVNNLGSVARQAGDPAEARRLHTEALEQYQDLGYRWGVAAAAGNLGVVLRESGELHEATRVFALGLSVAAEIGAKRAVAECLDGLGVTALEAGSREDAARYLAAADAVRAEIGVAPRAGSVDDLLGPGFEQAMEQGRTMTAAELVARAREQR